MSSTKDVILFNGDKMYIVDKITSMTNITTARWGDYCIVWSRRLLFKRNPMNWIQLLELNEEEKILIDENWPI